jgi:hypothetical protein
MHTQRLSNGEGHEHGHAFRAWITYTLRQVTREEVEGKMISGFCWVLIISIIGSLSQLSTQTVKVYQQLDQWGHARVRKKGFFDTWIWSFSLQMVTPTKLAIRVDLQTSLSNAIQTNKSNKPFKQTTTLICNQGNILTGLRA